MIYLSLFQRICQLRNIELFKLNQINSIQGSDCALIVDKGLVYIGYPPFIDISVKVELIV